MSVLPLELDSTRCQIQGVVNSAGGCVTSMTPPESLQLPTPLASAAERKVRDVDLMIIGDVRLKDIASALYASEQTLGRTVNPVLFSSEKFREQYREGNPFLLDVVRKEKIYLKGTRNELTELVADR